MACQVMRVGVATAGEQERLSDIWLRLGVTASGCAVIMRDGTPVGVIGIKPVNRARRRRRRIVGGLVVDREVALVYCDRPDLLFPNGGTLDQLTNALRVASLATLYEGQI
jgi:hypothetical protein